MLLGREVRKPAHWVHRELMVQGCQLDRSDVTLITRDRIRRSAPEYKGASTGQPSHRPDHFAPRSSRDFKHWGATDRLQQDLTRDLEPQNFVQCDKTTRTREPFPHARRQFHRLHHACCELVVATRVDTHVSQEDSIHRDEKNCFPKDITDRFVNDDTRTDSGAAD